ncbi:PFL_4695 family integrating conjugative element protein [Aromatoleum bremense]|nr:integrating conjugative element protein [Aromatoleum bremense]
MPATVIHDGGGVSLAPYLAGDEGSAREMPPSQQPAAPPQTPAVRAFPVASTRAGPGRLLHNPMPARLPGGPGTPFFVVGDDALSHAWLQHNAGRLQALGARGIVAAVASEADFARLRALAGVHLVPMSADALLEAAGIRVWPVLIGADGSISQ